MLRQIEGLTHDGDQNDPRSQNHGESRNADDHADLFLCALERPIDSRLFGVFFDFPMLRELFVRGIREGQREGRR